MPVHIPPYVLANRDCLEQWAIQATRFGSRRYRTVSKKAITLVCIDRYFSSMRGWRNISTPVPTLLIQNLIHVLTRKWK